MAEPVAAPLTTRILTRDALLAKVKARAAMAGVAVSPGDPGRGLERRHLYVAGITGVVQVKFMQGAAPYTHEDTFTITLVAKGGGPDRTSAEADAEAVAIAGEVLAVLSLEPTLGGVDGLRLLDMGSIAGPGHELLESGAASYVDIEITGTARYQAVAD